MDNNSIFFCQNNPLFLVDPFSSSFIIKSASNIEIIFFQISNLIMMNIQGDNIIRNNPQRICLENADIVK